MADSTGNFEGLMPVDFFSVGKERTDAMLGMQKDLLEAYEQASSAWVSRVKSEADLWSGLAAKLTNIRSVPDAVSAYQEGIAQRMQMAAEDGKKLAEETQKIMKTIMGSLPNGRGATT
jgi:hypothetical protein